MAKQPSIQQKTYALIGITILASSCIKGPGFMNSGADTSKNSRLIQKVKVETSGEKRFMETKVEGSRSTAKIDATSNDTQVMTASSNSSISGSRVEFPPGAIAVDTEVSLSPGQPIATTATLANMSIDNKIVAASAAVAVTSTVAIDTNVAYSVAIPLPDTSKLQLFGLAGADAYENLVVFYNVTKASSGSTVNGVILRSDIAIENGYAKIQTRYFGTFQAAITSTKIEATKEVAAAPLPPLPPSQRAAEIKTRRYFVDGPLTVSAPTSASNSDGSLRSWVSIVSPKSVGSDKTLTQGLKSFEQY